MVCIACPCMNAHLFLLLCPSCSAEFDLQWLNRTYGIKIPGLGVTDDSMWGMAEAILEVWRRHLAAELAASPFFSVSMDDTTSGTQTYTSIVVYYLEDDVPKCALLELAAIDRGDAASIEAATIKALRRWVQFPWEGMSMRMCRCSKRLRGLTAGHIVCIATG